MPWIINNDQPRSGKFVPGAYAASATVSVDDTENGIEILAADTAKFRYIAISTSGSPIYCKIGGNPTTTNYDFILPAGFNEINWEMNGQAMKAICAAGQTATILIRVAPVVEV